MNAYWNNTNRAQAVVVQADQGFMDNEVSSLKKKKKGGKKSDQVLSLYTNFLKQWQMNFGGSIRFECITY